MEATNPTQALDAIGFGLFQWLLLLYTGMAWFADACEVMLLSFLSQSVRCEWGLSAGAESTLTSVVFAGMLLGVSILGALADAIGRRKGYMLSAVLLGTAGLASAVAPSFGWLLAMRALVGVALGGNSIAVTLFAEYLPSGQRGLWLLALQSFWSIGTVFEALLAWAVLPPLGWRWLLVLSATPLLLLLVFYPILPESPHWLCVQGRYREAEAAVLRVAAINRYGRQLQVSFAPGSKDPSTDSPRAPDLQQEGPQRHPGPWVHLPEGTEWDEHGGGSGGGGAAAAGRGSAAGAAPSQEAGGSGPEEWLEESHRQQIEVGHHQGLVRKSRRRLLGGDEDGAHLQGPGTEAGGDGSLTGEDSDSGRADGGRMGGVAQQMWARLEQFPAVAQRALEQLFGPRLLCTTLLLYFIWFANAMLYYGLVLLTAALQTADKKEPCVNRKPNLAGPDFKAILVTSMAEAPGLLVAALLVDSVGRRWSLRGLLLSCGCSLLLLGLSPGAQAWKLALLFIARGAIEGAYSALYIYTPEVYNTSVRSFGLSLCNAFSRIGGGLAPYATVYLVDQKDSKASETLLGTLCLGAVVAAFFLPFETKGVDLHGHDHDMPAEPPPAELRPMVAGEHPPGGPPSVKAVPLMHIEAPHAAVDIAGVGVDGLSAGPEAGRAGEKAPLLTRHAGPSASGA